MENIYTSSHLQRKHYQVDLSEQEKLLRDLSRRTDPESVRLQRYLSLPDLTRLEGSPVKTITDRILNLPTLRNFDLIETPHVNPTDVVFDLFNFPANHPARSRSDTYYVDDTHILRPHTSLMWKHYLEIPTVVEELEKNGSAGVLCHGTVYRKDEIDWEHTNVLHHIDGLFLCKKELKQLNQADLEAILWEVAHALFGEETLGQFNVEHYPYTDPSLEMEIAWDDRWVEILGAGIVHSTVIKNLGLDPEVYNGWAFGFGADRLAMIKMKIPDIRLLRSGDERVLRQFHDIDHEYVSVSKYPPVVRDISFIVPNDVFNLNRYYEMTRELIGDDYVEEVKLLDTYSDPEKFGSNNTSYTFRVTYRRLDRTLTSAEVDDLHHRLEQKTVSDFSAIVR